MVAHQTNYCGGWHNRQIHTHSQIEHRHRPTHFLQLTVWAGTSTPIAAKLRASNAQLRVRSLKRLSDSIIAFKFIILKAGLSFIETIDAIILAVLIQDQIHPYSSGSSLLCSPHHQQAALVTLVAGVKPVIPVPFEF